MIVAPTLNQPVQIWYAARWRPLTPLHGKVGTITTPSRGKPRNHGVTVEGVEYVVPCGNIRRVQ